MLKVGIHQDLVITKTEKNDKGSLVIGVKKISSVNPLDRLNSSTGSTSFEAEENDFLVYPPQTTNFSGEKLDAEKVMKSIASVVDPLAHILSQYITKDKIKWDLFKDTGVTSENYSQKVTEEETLTKIYNNIVAQFTAAMKPFIGENGKKLRGIFPRQSKAKHFPALRKSFLESQPIFEPMTVPAEQSKLKFSKYEIDNGLNLAEAVTAQQQVSTEDAKSAESLFAK